jgi:large subunit ribosomal protein L4
MATKTTVKKTIVKKEIKAKEQKLEIFDIEKDTKKSINLPEFLKTKFNKELFAKVIRVERLNLIITSANTKTRGKVRGGGIKPYRQKGTGNARAGSRRSPIWRGGGITFGPTSAKTFNLKINQKEKKMTLKMLLTAKKQDNRLLVIDKIGVKEAKTKLFIDQVLKIAKIKPEITTTKIVFIASKKEKNVDLASRNIPNIQYIGKNEVNILLLAKKNMIILDAQALSDYQKYLEAK